jgi:phospho-N-acetylmuramoyl-pentapeptide-transferase
VIGLLGAAAAALVIGLVGTAWLIRFLVARGIGQPIHEAVTQHASKAGTPMMGGLVLSVAAPVGYAVGLAFLWRAPSASGIVLVAAIVAGGIVGAVDDWLKARRGRNTHGLRERQKTILLLAVAVGYVIFALAAQDGGCRAPSLARCEPLPNLGSVGWAVWVLIVVWTTTNSVNFTDGLDGLLAGTSVAPLGLLSAIAFWQFRHPDIYGTDGALGVALVMIAMTAGCAGLLWWSAAPAAVFMGETGSLAIGSAIAIASLELHVELLIPVFGAVFVLEGLSSFSQRMWFKFTRAVRSDHQPQRLFRMAPIHHHFEVGGWPETTITIRFWILSALSCGLAAAIFYSDALGRV